MKTFLIKYLLLVFLPLFLGGAIYILLSPNNNLNNIFSIKSGILYTKEISKSIYQHLPDFLWAFSLANFLFIYNRSKNQLNIGVNILLVIIVSFSFEFGQLYGLIEGTFDTLDLFVYISGILCSYSMSKLKIL